jgi:hypothetical protein
MPILHSLRFIWVALSLLIAWPAVAANDAPIEAFFGTYEGKSVAANGEEEAERDIMVSIKPIDEGFNVSWKTSKHKSDGQVKQKDYSINFEKTKRQSIFGSAMRRNTFGDRVPLNPLEGDPYVWARITEKTLTVYALHITTDGSYEMQVYHRTLTDKGLDLKFTRFGEGKPLKIVTATLTRVDE